MQIILRKVHWIFVVAIAVFFLVRWFVDEEREAEIQRSQVTPEKLLIFLKGAGFEAVPGTPSGAELNLAKFGYKLFRDKNLSANGQVSCATCHVPSRSFTDGRAVAQGLELGARNTPTIINSFQNSWFFWDGRADSLESQALKPIESNAEHGLSRSQLVAKVIENHAEEYTSVFKHKVKRSRVEGFHSLSYVNSQFPALPVSMAAYTLATIGNFKLLNGILDLAYKAKSAPALLVATMTRPEGGAVGFDFKDSDRALISRVAVNVASALAAYERTILATNSAFDRYRSRVLVGGKGDDPRAYLNEEFGRKAFEGLNLFVGKGRCSACHHGPNFSDQQFHNIGLPDREHPLHDRTDVFPDMGRAIGLIKVLNDPMNCLGSHFNHEVVGRLESCEELPYLDVENTEHVGAFKTPTLRNLSDTAPYGHDGRFATIEEVLRHYNKPSIKPAVGHREETLNEIDLSASEQESLSKFLKALGSPTRDLTEEVMVQQGQLSKKTSGS